MVHNPVHDLFSIGHFLCRVSDTNQPKYLSRLGYSLLLIKWILNFIFVFNLSEINVAVKTPNIHDKYENFFYVWISRQKGLQQYTLKYNITAQFLLWT